MMIENNQLVENNRIAYIDIAKGIGILFVMLGHCLYSEVSPIRLLIYSFHMPLFFVLSGMTYKTCACKKLKDTISNSIRRKKFLFAVYIIFSCVFICRDFIRWHYEKIFNLKQLIYCIYSTLILDGINVLWFIGTLISVELLYDLLRWKFSDDYKKQFTSSLVISLVATLLYLTVTPILTNRFILAPMHSVFRPASLLIFFTIGSSLKKLIYKPSIYAKRCNTTNYIIAVLILIIMGLLGVSNGFVDVHNMIWGHTWIISYFVATSLSLDLIWISRKLESFSIICKFCSYLGKNSLFIMITHNYLGVKDISEKISELCLGTNEHKDYLTFFIMLIIELILVKLIGEKVMDKIKKRCKNS